MCRPIWQKQFSQPQHAEQAHAQNTQTVIQALVISSHFCVSQGKSLGIRAGVTPGRGFGKELNTLFW